MQHDVQEFFMMLLESIDRKMRGDEAMMKLFRGTLEIKLRYLDRESIRTESFNDIQVEV